MRLDKRRLVALASIVALLAAIAGGLATTSAHSSRAAGPTPIGVALTYNNTAFWAAYINYQTQYAKQMNIKLLGPLLAGTNASLQNRRSRTS